MTQLLAPLPVHVLQDLSHSRQTPFKIYVFVKTQICKQSPPSSTPKLHLVHPVDVKLTQIMQLTLLHFEHAFWPVKLLDKYPIPEVQVSEQVLLSGYK